MDRRKNKARKDDSVPLIAEMSNEELLQAMETLVKALGLELRYEKGDFKGGVCRIHDQQLVVMQKKASIENKIKILARELGTLELEHVYVMPAVQKIIDLSRKESVQPDDLFLEED